VLYNAFQWIHAPKLPLPMEDLGPHLTCGFLGPGRVGGSEVLMKALATDTNTHLHHLLITAPTL